MSVKSKARGRVEKRERQFQAAMDELFPKADIEKLRSFLHGDWDDCIKPSLVRLMKITREANDTEESLDNIRINQATIFVLKYLLMSNH